MMKEIKEIFAYKEMIRNLVYKGLRARYKGSVLGFLWTFLNPLLQLLVYTVVFSLILRPGVDNFAMYLFVALIPWLFFSGSITDSTACILANGSLVKKVYFPRSIVPISTVMVNFINMLLTFIIVFIALYITGFPLTIYTLYLPVLFIVQFIITLGISFIVACVSVYFRDLQHIIGIVVMMWFYLTPIIYDISIVPDNVRAVFLLNPMTSIVTAYRELLYYRTTPTFDGILLTFGVGIVLLIFGYILFNRLQKRFAEEI